MIKNVIVYDVPLELRRQFKIFCAYKEISMSKAIREFMQKQVETIIIKE